MRKAILYIIILSLAGCNITALNKKKEEGLKEMPVTQVAPQKAETSPQMEVLPVAQMVGEIKEKEKFYSLSVKDMELRKVLFMFSTELPEYNLVIDPDVSGKVSVDFKELPLDKALTILLDPLGLEYTIEDNILRISMPRFVTRIFEFVYSTTIREARSSLVAITGSEDEATSSGGESGGSVSGSSTTSFGSIETRETINVWAEMESGIRDLLSEEGKLSISKRIGRISVTDYRSNMKEITSFIDVFKRATKIQILIRAKILEVTFTEGYAFGIDWTLVLKDIDILAGTQKTPFTATHSLAPPALTTFGFAGFAPPVTLGITHSDLSLVIKALETQGDVRVLSAPEVSTLNGQKAIIRSVREDAVFESQQSQEGATAVSSTTVKPFTFGVFLDVTPHVDSEGMITMDIHPSVSSFVGTATPPEGDSGFIGGSSKPIIDTRETETVATVKDGETIVIAGLMQDNIQKRISKTPLLGDIPYLGKLWRREVTESQKTELIILITPTVVGPRAKDFVNTRAKYKMLRNHFSY